MKIRFLNPPIFDLVGQHYQLNQATGGPLLSAILRRAGHDAGYVDCEYFGWGMGEVSEYLQARAPDAIGVTVTNLNWKGAKRLVGHIKKHFPSIFIALGGPEITARSEEAKELGADCIALGECDLNIAEIFETKPAFVPRGPLPQDLNALPFPAWEFSSPPPTAYGGNAPRFEAPEVCTLWNRGCAHKCTFCSNPIFNQVIIRERGPANIVDELKVLKGMGARHVFVYSDELIGMSPRQGEWVAEVCEAIIKADLGLTFKTQGRCKWVSPKVLNLMAQAGFKAIMWGIESLSPRVLQEIKKGITLDDVWETLELSHKAGIQNWGFFMVGCPGETEEEFRLTVQGVAEMKARDLLQFKQVTVCTPSPGTELWEQASSAGWLKIPPTSTGHFHQEPVMEFPYASTREIKRRLAILSLC